MGRETSVGLDLRVPFDHSMFWGRGEDINANGAYVCPSLISELVGIVLTNRMAFGDPSILDKANAKYVGPCKLAQRMLGNRSVP